MTVEHFRGHVGEEFRIHSGDGQPRSVRLIAALDLPHACRALRAPFELMFVEDRENWLPQGTYTFEHHALGRMDIFIVPVAHDAQGTRYQVVFG